MIDNVRYNRKDVAHVYLFLIGMLLILIFGFKKYLVYKLRKTDVYNDQKELVKQLKDNNEISFQKQRKQMLPFRYKLGYLLLITMAVMGSIVYGNLHFAKEVFYKIIVVFLFSGLMGYSINLYNRKINEFMYINSKGIYKKIAKNALEIIKYMKMPMFLLFFLIGVCMLIAVI